MAPKRREDATQFIKQRNLCKSNIERICEVIETRGTELTSTELECRLEILQTYFHEALENQTAVEELGIESELIVAHDMRSALEDLYCQAKSKNLQLTTKTREIQPKSKTFNSVSSDNLPKLKLPIFTGKYADYPNFIHLFKTLVDNDERLTKVEKFNHLLSCLSGGALRTVKALDVTDENYSKAMALMESRYNNKYLMCEEHIKSLFTLQKTSKGSADQLRMLADSVTARFNALCSLSTFEEIANALVVHIVIAALDNESHQKVEEAIDYSKSFSWDQCAAVLSKRCQVLEARSSNSASENRRGPEKRPQAVSFAATSSFCNMCKGHDHHIWKCSKFLELSPQQRYNAAKSAQLCINCLSGEHSAKQCKASACKQCKLKHHTLLHRVDNTSFDQYHKGQQALVGSTNQNRLSYNKQFQVNDPVGSYQHLGQQQQLQQQFINNPARQANNSFMPATTPENTFTPAAPAAGKYCHVSNDEPNPTQSHTILATALVEIFDQYGNKYLARALLDSASQLNFITRNLAQKLNLAKIKSATIIGGIGQARCSSNYITTAIVSSRNDIYSTSLDFSIIPAITGQQPSRKFNTADWNIPENIQLADPQFNVPQKVDLLIGADIFFELFDGSRINLGTNLPSLLHTKFGWIFSGKYSSSNQTQYSLITHCDKIKKTEYTRQMMLCRL